MMDPIQSISAGASRPIVAPRTDAAASSSSGGVAQSTSAATQSVSLSSTSTTTQITISQQVDSFLGSIDPALGNNQYLKLLIAALIMQVLLGEEGSGQQREQSGLAALEGLAGRNSALHISIESATNTVQMQQQSSRLDVIGAVQTLSNADMTGGDTGQQMDVSG